MPDIGMLELSLIGIIAFLVLGPERLPHFFSQIAGFVRQGREWIENIKQQFDAEKEQIIHPITSIKQEVDTSIQGLKDDLQSTNESSTRRKD